MKIGLVCEGGGTKGAYTAGVLSCFIDQNITFDYCVGISSGTVNLMGYISKDKEFLKNVSVNLTTDDQLVGLKALKNEGQLYGIDRLFMLMENSSPFNTSTAKENPIECETGVYHIQSGEIKYFDKNYLINNIDLAKASCALLMLAKPVQLNNELYMDAGLKVMIPIQRSIDKGCEKHIFISTKESNFQRKKAPMWQRILCKIWYPKQKHVQEDLYLRDERYQQQWNQVLELEKQNKALVLRPSKDMQIKRSTQDAKKLSDWYELGYQDTLEKIELIKAFIQKNH